MKKIVFLVAALMAVFSGIAAVSAYEGHTVDIKVHVENALGVETYNLNLGTRFPQEYVETDLTFGMSQSFRAQTRLSSIGYKLAFELKPLAGHGPPIPAPAYLTNYFQPLNPFLTVTALKGTATIEPPAVYRVKPALNGFVLVGTGTLSKTLAGTGTLCETIHFHMDVPVFEGYYNAITDVPPGMWRFVQLEDNLAGDPAEEFVVVSETLGCENNMPVKVPHADLGINFKIQVTGFVPHATPTP